MTNATDIHGAVFENSSAVLLARIVDADGSTATASSIASANYTIAEIGSSGAAGAPVSGHDQAPLSPAEIMHDTLQTSPIWTVDQTGFNFQHLIDVSTDEAFPTAGRRYQVRYVLQPASGQKIVFRFLLRAI